MVVVVGGDGVVAARESASAASLPAAVTSAGPLGLRGEPGRGKADVAKLTSKGSSATLQLCL